MYKSIFCILFLVYSTMSLASNVTLHLPPDSCIDNPNLPEQKCAVDYGDDDEDKNHTIEHGSNTHSGISKAQDTKHNSQSVAKLSDNGQQCVVVKGSASSKDVSKAFARKMAIRDALQQASLKNNVVVKTDQSVEAYQLKLDSSRFISNSKVKSFDVLKEGYEDSNDMYGKTKAGPLNYEVTMNVCLTEERGICTNLPGNKYQTRLAIAPVVFAHASQANDISNLLNGYQLELDRRIRKQGYKNYTLLEQPVDLQPNLQVAPNLDPKLLTSIRNQTGAQYLLLTVLRSMSSHQEDSVLNSMKRLYDLEVKPTERHIEADWYVVDLMRYEIVHQTRGGFDVKGDVTVGRDRPFGTNAFFATDTGKVFHVLLEQEVNDALDYLHCKKFESEIIDVRDNEYVIYLNANSGARVGDDFAVYHKTGRPVRFNGMNLGTDQTPGAFLKITRIMPRFAIAEVTAKKGTIQVGDIVKAW